MLYGFHGTKCSAGPVSKLYEFEHMVRRMHDARKSCAHVQNGRPPALSADALMAALPTSCGKLASLTNPSWRLADIHSKAMRLLIIIAVLEIIAIIVVVSLCIAARRGDVRTERMLSSDEIEARRQVTDGPRRISVIIFSRNAATRWFSRLFHDSRS